MGLPSFWPAVLCDGQPRGQTATCRMGGWGVAARGGGKEAETPEAV